MSKYAIGVDYGTLSARALIVDVSNGRELADATMDYAHGVMTHSLPDGTPLRPDWALEHPQDYLDCLRAIIPEALRRANVSADDVIGLGVDFTADTMLSIDASGNPLCLKPEFASVPHAWPMLWKHHAAQSYAERIEQISQARSEAFLAHYGGRVSSEWMLPKLWQIADEAPEVYATADRFIEAGDWIVFKLTGCEARAAAMAGFKAFYRNDYPSKDFLRTLSPLLENLIDEKLSRSLYPLGARAGAIDAFGAALTGLNPGTSVAVANIDAHVSLPPVGVVDAGKMLMILGTSACHLMLGETEQCVSGICGVVKDGMVPGLYAYEAGQSCCGDHFKWFADNCVPRAYADEADRLGVGIQQLLTTKAEALKPGQSGLIALDWWNGNRSVLTDFDLSGLIVGLTLASRPEEIYRALIEATAFGARKIVEAFESQNLPVHALYACGGIAKKNPMLMQIYADVLGREIRVCSSAQAPALGSAMFAAVAAGRENGGWTDIAEAARHMAAPVERTYAPVPENRKVYDEMYLEYSALHDYFGRGGNDVMKRLRRLRERTSAQR